MGTLAPRSVIYRTGTRLASVGVITVIGLRQLLVAVGIDPGPAGWAAMIAVAIGVTATVELAAVRRVRFALTPAGLQLEQGVLRRDARRIPLHRIQRVDIAQSLPLRLLDLATVRFRSAGGGGAEAELRHLRRADAVALADRFDAIAQQAHPETTATAEQELLFRLDRGGLLRAGIYGVDLRVLGGITAAVSTIGPSVADQTALGTVLLRWVSADAAVLAGMTGLVLIGAWGVGAVRRMVRFAGFTVERTAEGYRYSGGFGARYQGTIPAEKLQSVQLVDSPVSRRFGYAGLTAQTAGGVDGAGGSTTVVPLAPTPEVRAVAAALGAPTPPRLRRPPLRARQRYRLRVVALVAGIGVMVTLLGGWLPVVVPWWAPLLLVVPGLWLAGLQWRHRGYHIDDERLTTRTGVLRRRTTVVPLEKVQTVRSRSTLLQRRRTLASVGVDTAGGAGATAIDIDARAVAAVVATLRRPFVRIDPLTLARR
jgi:putative membrane protein